MATASASPNALASPRMTPVRTDVRAAGMTIWWVTCHLVAPSPYAAILADTGTALIASAATVVIDGKIMTARTIPPARTLRPVFRWNRFWMKGTRTVIPIQP